MNRRKTVRRWEILRKTIALAKNLFALLGVVSVLIWVLLPRGEIARLDNSPTSFDYEKDNVHSSTTPLLTPGSTKPKNIILFLADGMGFAHLEFARALHDDAIHSDTVVFNDTSYKD